MYYELFIFFKANIYVWLDDMHPFPPNLVGGLVRLSQKGAAPNLPVHITAGLPIGSG